ncbi:Ankyrin repeat domain-containing protein 50 [Linum perenne]
MPLFSDSATVGLLAGKQQVTVFVSSGPVYLSAGKQVYHVDYQTQVSQQLVDAAHRNDTKLAIECLSDPFCDVNFIGTVSLRSRKTEVVLNGESAHEVRFDYEEFRTDVTALFLAAHAGNSSLVKKLLCGVDANAIDRILLQSSKPMLHTNVYSNALAAAIVSRQTSVVKLLLQAGVRLDTKVRIGAWSWDMETGEEIRVGAGLAEAYCVTWCAVEYFESTGAILRMLLGHIFPNVSHQGRTLIHHAILCNKAEAVEVLVSCGADVEYPAVTSRSQVRPIHLATRLGSTRILEQLITAANVNSTTNHGETALMISVKCKQDECLKILASAGADFGLVDSDGDSVTSIARRENWELGFRQAVMEVIRSGKSLKSSCVSIFSPLAFSIRSADLQALKKLTEKADVDLDEQDEDGFTALMVAAAGGHVDAFKLLLQAGADVKLRNKRGETAMNLAELNRNRVELFEKALIQYGFINNQMNIPVIGNNALHRAAVRGEQGLVQILIAQGCDVNAIDGDGYTPLMLAARGGHGKICSLLISSGARVDFKNERNETALILAKKGGGGEAVDAILDYKAREMVLEGGRLKKHSRGGKGKPHYKAVEMVPAEGVLRWEKWWWWWGKTSVVCKEAKVGPATKFRWNRRRTADLEEPGLFHVVTTKGKVVHFVCEDGGDEMAELWVRGIKIVTREAIFGKR